jgi:transcriptional regulator with PAS, ATPase and Fis domain
VPSELVTLLGAYPFPGNVRELQTLVFDAVSRHKRGTLSPDVFKSHIRLYQSRENVVLKVSDHPPETGTTPIKFSENLPTIRQATDLLVAEALKRSGGNQSAAAALLGISQQALSKRLQKKMDAK